MFLKRIKSDLHAKRNGIFEMSNFIFAVYLNDFLAKYTET